MNMLPLSGTETGAVAQTMFDLNMLLPVDGVPQQPELIPGRESDCIIAQLGMQALVGVVVDAPVKGYLDAHRHYITWHPDEPAGISAHKLSSPHWIISAAEVRVALATLDRTSASEVDSARQSRFAAVEVGASIWEDWVTVLRGSADSGCPVRIANPGYEGPLIVAELLEQE
ncbi:hypothetical protein ACIBBE_24215 [Streptomyces sp. NPDC051644]|uniref:hypothetical protein n=1 Tax=Streptomyces sp. NPDC051644 TaxID=3365666 RepID=UPI00379A3E8B